MGDLRDQLKKAGLISAKKARKLGREDDAREHKRRKAERKGDQETLAELETDAERAARELHEAEAERRRLEAERVEAERLERQEREHWARVHEIIDSNRLRPGRGGGDWQFVASDGHVESIGVSEEVAEGLRQAMLAVVERPPRDADPEAHRFLVLPAEAALRVEELDAYAIRFLNLPARKPPLVVGADAAKETGTSTADAPTEGADPGAEDDFLSGL